MIIALEGTGKEQKIAIEKRAELSGLKKSDYITRCCLYNKVVVVGKKENINKLVDELQEMKAVMIEIAGQMLSGDFALEQESFNDMKEEYIALLKMVVDILAGAEYLFQDESV